MLLTTTLKQLLQRKGVNRMSIWSKIKSAFTGDKPPKAPKPPKPPKAPKAPK